MHTQRHFTASICIILFILAIVFSFNSEMPKAKLVSNLPESEFSLKRALVHLKAITQKPHYLGSEGHAEVREYIIGELEKLDLNVEVQTQIVLGNKRRTTTKVKNIIARIKGKENGKALLLLSHYDSKIHASYGASDAGSGVVTILEGVRTYLSQGKKPTNDIIILITDAEELGLLGAQAFVENHPWSKEVGLVLNFEARGSGGPSYMFLETNGGNKNLIKAFQKANPEYPVANSLAYSIYKMMPNDTDLTVFRELDNINGFNFAFIDDHFDYHTSQDNYDRLDRNTLQHQATYLMPLLSYFADADLDELDSEKDLVYTNFPGLGFVSFPYDWVIPILISLFILFIILVFIGLKKKYLNLKQIFVGFIPLFVSVISVGVFSYYGWQLVLKIHPAYETILHGFTYNGHYYITAFIALSIWLTLWIYKKFTTKNKAPNLLVAPIFLWMILNTVLALYLTGGSFFLLAPLSGLIVLSLFLFYHKNYSWRIISATFMLLPLLILTAPSIPSFPVALGLKMLIISTLIACLILVLFIPVFSYFRGFKKLINLFLIIGLLSLISASFSSGFDENNKHPDSIVYVNLADENKSYWASNDVQTDAYTEQFLGKDPQQGTFMPPEAKDFKFFNLHKKAKNIPIEESSFIILRDSVQGNQRSITAKLQIHRPVNNISVVSTGKMKLIDLTINGQVASLKDDRPYLMDSKNSGRLFNYVFTESEEVLEFRYTIPKEDDPSLILYEVTYGLLSNPAIRYIKPNLKPRPDHLMEKIRMLNDAILVKKEIRF